jgi:hypothetical protein
VKNPKQQQQLAQHIFRSVTVFALPFAESRKQRQKTGSKIVVVNSIEKRPPRGFFTTSIEKPSTERDS